MTEYEVGQTFIEYLNTLNQLTEFWLTISFAVVVAVTYAPERLERKFFTLIWAGYLAASVILFLNRINLSLMLISLVSTNTKAGVTTPFFQPIIGSMAGGGNFLLMIIGTAGIIYYVRNIGKKCTSKST